MLRYFPMPVMALSIMSGNKSHPITINTNADTNPAIALVDISNILLIGLCIADNPFYDVFQLTLLFVAF